MHGITSAPEVLQVAVGIFPLCAMEPQRFPQHSQGWLIASTLPAPQLPHQGVNMLSNCVSLATIWDRLVPTLKQPRVPPLLVVIMSHCHVNRGHIPAWGIIPSRLYAPFQDLTNTCPVPASKAFTQLRGQTQFWLRVQQ